MLKDHPSAIRRPALRASSPSPACRAQTYRAMERHEEALDDYDRAIKLDPKYAWAI
ncbi:tetratricopeptide repeat protein [Actinoplanes sp. NPDC051475]|uniref:tetratricopeptide repeat protein n=1 Tax=Actinoplanes sp. NPDC051475 TaxID=3157225 RepID=UPI00344EFF7F